MATKKNTAPEPEALEGPQPPTEDEASPEEPLVVVQKVYTDQGGVNAVVVGIQGKIEPTEVQTLLELAVRSWREQIGLSG